MALITVEMLLSPQKEESTREIIGNVWAVVQTTGVPVLFGRKKESLSPILSAAKVTHHLGLC
jgi:hypothetical protein